jgi:hypothetical protein
LWLVAVDLGEDERTRVAALLLFVSVAVQRVVASLLF